MSRRSAAIGLVLIGVLLVLLAGSRPWATLSVPDLAGMRHLSVPGRRAAPAAVPIALAAAAAAFVLVTAGRLVRVLLALGLGLGGAAIVAGGLQVARNPSVAATDALRDSFGLASSRSGAAALGSSFRDTTADLTGWPWVASAGGLLIVLAAVLVLLTGRSWPQTSRRFERQGFERQGFEQQGSEQQGSEQQGSEQQGSERQGGDPAAISDTPLATWDALSRGEDPT